MSTRVLEQEVAALVRQRKESEQRLRELRPGGVRGGRFAPYGAGRGRGEGREFGGGLGPVRGGMRRPLAPPAEEVPESKTRLTSAVVSSSTPSAVTAERPTGTPGVEHRPHAPTAHEVPEVKQRSRKMFGLIMGTLQKFKEDVSKEQKSETMRKRQEITQKIEHELAENQQRERERRRREAQEKRDAERALRNELFQKQLAAELALAKARLTAHYTNMARFLVTKAGPAIAYLPNKHNAATEALLQKRSEEMAAKLQSIAELSEEFIRPPREPRMEEGGVMGALGGGGEGAEAVAGEERDVGGKRGRMREEDEEDEDEEDVEETRRDATETGEAFAEVQEVREDVEMGVPASGPGGTDGGGNGGGGGDGAVATSGGDAVATGQGTDEMVEETVSGEQEKVD